MLTVALTTLSHERKLIERYLDGEHERVVTAEDRLRILPARRRTSASLQLLARGDLARWWRQRRRNAMLVTLAFEKWHLDREDALGDSEASHHHAVRVRQLRKQLKALGVD